MTRLIKQVALATLNLKCHAIFASLLVSQTTKAHTTYLQEYDNEYTYKDLVKVLLYIHFNIFDWKRKWKISFFFSFFFFFFGKRKSYSIRVRYTFGHSSKMLPCIWVHFWIGCIVLLFLQLGAARTKICGTIFTTVTCFNTELG